VNLRRRQLLQGLGLGVGAGLGVFSRERSALAGAPAAPSRIVFYVQPHGHIPNAWNMAIPGGPADQFAERSLLDLDAADLSPTLRPLYGYRDRLLAIEGLSHTAALADIAAVTRAGTGDLNNHQIGVADVLTGSRALQRTGTYCSGGARTLDQELAMRTAGPGRFDSRVYGFDYIPNSVVSPFSYLGPGQATPMVSEPNAAFSDLLGYAIPAPATTSRADLLRSLRPSVLDAVGREYDLLAPKLHGQFVKRAADRIVDRQAIFCDNGAGVGERQPRELAKRDDAGPALELVPKPKFANDAASAGFPDPQHEAGDGRVRKCTYAALFDCCAREPDKGSGHKW